MNNWRQSVFQVIDRVGSDRRILGTAFAIFGGRVLTCGHVMKAHRAFGTSSRDPNAEPFVLPDCALFNSAEYGMVSGVEWALHSHLDVACGRVPDGTPLPASLRIEPTAVHPGMDILCAGFPTGLPDSLTYYRRSVATWSSERGLVLDGALAPGMSGGPALVDDRVVGIVYADLADQNLAFVVPLVSILRWIEATFPAQADPEHPDDLSAVPIAGAVTPLDLRSEVVDAFANKFDDPGDAKRFFNEAMRLRKSCNPEGFTDQQILVSSLDIKWDAAPRHFWYRILDTSLRRSQRTLAALFYVPNAPNPEFLSGDEQRIFRELKEKLKTGR